MSDQVAQIKTFAHRTTILVKRMLILLTKIKIFGARMVTPFTRMSIPFTKMPILLTEITIFGARMSILLTKMLINLTKMVVFYAEKSEFEPKSPIPGGWNANNGKGTR